MTINWHIAMHYAHFVRLYGPLPGYGTWAFERNNGKLSNVKHNGKLLSDLATTLMRHWLREVRLAAVVNNPDPEAEEAEIEALLALLEDRSLTLGTLMLDEARGNAANWTMRLPDPYRPKTNVDLVAWNIYQELLDYLDEQHPDYDFVDAAFVNDRRPGLPRSGAPYKIYTHAVYTGFK